VLGVSRTTSYYLSSAHKAWQVTSVHKAFKGNALMLLGGANKVRLLATQQEKGVRKIGA
jgi:hypothetical protein